MTPYGCCCTKTQKAEGCYGTAIIPKQKQRLSSTITVIPAMVTLKRSHYHFLLNDCRSMNCAGVVSFPQTIRSYGYIGKAPTRLLRFFMTEGFLRKAYLKRTESRLETTNTL